MRRVVAVITLLLGATASADPERAKQLSAEADALVARGDLIGAAAKFRAAYKEEPRADHICNSGVAYHKAKDLPRSHRYLNQCVAMGSSLDAAYRDNLRKVIESIEQKLVAGDFTPIDVALEPATAVLVFENGKPYDEELVGGGRLWVPYGAYRLIVRAPGFVENRSELTANRHAAISLRVTLERTVETPIETRIEKPIAQPIEKSTEDTPTGPSKLPPIIVTTLTGATAIGALVFYVRARGFSEDAADAALIEDFNDKHEQAHANQRIAWVLGGVAGASAIVASYLWWRYLRAPARVEVTSTGNGVAIRGRF